MIKNTPEQLTKRHYAKLCTKLKPLQIPGIAFDAIKIEMQYLVADILSLSDKESQDGDNEKNYNR